MMSPKPPPLQYDRYYHIYNRGINRQNVFFEERNYRHFLKLYAKHFEPVADTYAYCLMCNHFHFLVRIKTVEEQQTPGVSKTPGVWKAKKTSQQFGNVLNAYAKSINKAYNRTGSLFQNRFGRIEVTSDAYFIHLITYIHRNPQRHGFVADFRDWPYSSYHAILSTKPSHVKRDEVLGWFDNATNFEASHQHEADLQKIPHLVVDDFD
jgi:putative transposase